MGSSSPTAEGAACCSCACDFFGRRRRRPEPRSLKRKLDDVEEFAFPRVEPEDEIASLREAVEGHREIVSQLCAELDEERAASASAANEAMSMILRLQREKGAIQLEAHQFRRFAEEKMEHDRGELLALERLLEEREQTIQALSSQVRGYHEHLLTCGFSSDSLEANWDAHAFEERDHGEDEAQPLAPIIGDAEKLKCSPSLGTVGDEREKGMVMGEQPSYAMPTGDPVGNSSTQQVEEILPSGCSGVYDDMSDRVYTVDAVHNGEAEAVGVGSIRKECASKTKEPICRVDGLCSEVRVDIRKLEIRLRALDVDRESMRQAIFSAGFDKAQLIICKEIAQHLLRNVSFCSASQPGRLLVKKPFMLWCFSFMSKIKATILTQSLLWHSALMYTIKWIMSLVFCKKRDRSNCRYVTSHSNNVGLLLLLDKAPRIQQLICLSGSRATSV